MLGQFISEQQFNGKKMIPVKMTVIALCVYISCTQAQTTRSFFSTLSEKKTSRTRNAHWPHHRTLLCSAAVASIFAILAVAAPAQAKVYIDGGTTVTVPGTETNPWDIGSTLYVGYDGDGTLDIGAGGRVTAFGSYIGFSSNSTGTIKVSGEGAILQISDALAVGYLGKGDLTIESGGAVTSAYGWIGYDAGSTGKVTVSGDGARWESTNSFYVGWEGNGTLNIGPGGTVATTAGYNSYLGYYEGSTGTAIVSGEGALWENSGDLYVGQMGSGDLTIGAGGKVTDINGLVGVNQGSTGTVLVSGEGARWENSDEVYVGYLGTGGVTIANGGAVSADAVELALKSESSGTINIGAAAGQAAVSTGTLDTPEVVFGAGNGTIVFNHTDSDYVFGAAIVSNSGTSANAGTVLVQSGTTIMTGTSTYFGDTQIEGGTLWAGAADVFSANSDYTVSGPGTLNLNDYDQTIDSMNNAGTVSLSGTGALTNTRLTISHDYVGNGGSLILDTVLGDDNSETDKVIIEGQASGLTYVMINNAGGTGGETVDGIEIITTQGSTDDAFVKGGRIVAGAYEYDVAKSGNNWYLVNYIPQPPTEPEVPTEPETPTPIPEPPDEGNGGGDGGIKVMRPESGAYIANLAAANTMFLSRLHDRLGETQYTNYLTGETKVTSMWLRQEGGHNRSRTQSGQVKTQTNRYVVQIGGDVAQWSSNGLDRLNLGVMAGYGYSHGNTDAKYSAYRSKNKVDGYALGLYSTWYANQVDKSGLYVDSWVQYAWFDNTVQGDGLAQENYDSKGWLASLETGYSFKMGSSERVSYWLQPKAQVTWMGVHADKHYEANGTKVTGNGDNLSTRLGLRAYRQGHSEIDDNTGRVFQPFVEANWIYNSKNFGVAMNGVSDYQAGTRNIGEVKVGLEAHLSNNLNMWGSIGQQIGGEGYSDTQAIFGIKYSF